MTQKAIEVSYEVGSSSDGVLGCLYPFSLRRSVVPGIFKFEDPPRCLLISNTTPVPVAFAKNEKVAIASNYLDLYIAELEPAQQS